MAEAEKLAQFEIAGERRLKLALPMLYTGELDRIVRETITRHNGDAGHAYKGHGTHAEIETAPGVWERREPLPPLS